MPAYLGPAVPEPQYSGVWIKDDTEGYRELVGVEAVEFALPSESGGGRIKCEPDPEDPRRLRVHAIEEPMSVAVAGGVQLMGLHNVAGLLVEPGATDLTVKEDSKQ